MNIRKTLAALAITAGSIALGAGVSHADTSAAPARHVPTPAEVQIYLCTVHHGADAGCAVIPGVWNRFAGRITPVRWDPCAPGSSVTLFYFQACGPMTPTIRQWCTLHFDHRYLGREMCA